MDILLRDKLPYDDVETIALRHALREIGYSCPDDKIVDMVRCGELLRLRRGYFVLNEALRRSPLPLPVIAGTLSGPSYISLEYALAFHGLIPEHVYEITSVCLGRSRRFETPIGNFSYQSVPRTSYTGFFDVHYAADGRPYFMAAPEKALVDTLAARRNVQILSQRDLAAYLIEDMRIEESDFLNLNINLIVEAAESYGTAKTALLVRLLSRMKRRRKNDAA